MVAKREKADRSEEALVSLAELPYVNYNYTEGQENHMTVDLESDEEIDEFVETLRAQLKEGLRQAQSGNGDAFDG